MNSYFIIFLYECIKLMVLKIGPVPDHDSGLIQLIGLESDQIGGPTGESDETSGSIFFFFFLSPSIRAAVPIVADH